jgi:5-methylcytosine-specific restriction protein B
MHVEQEFTLGGQRRCVSRTTLEQRLAREQPEAITKYVVEIGGRRFPVKQAVAVGVGIPVASFTTHQAFRLLQKLGYEPTHVDPKYSQ